MCIIILFLFLSDRVAPTGVIARDGNVRGRFEGDTTRLSRVEIQAKRGGSASEFTTVSKIEIRDVSFSTELPNMEEGATYRAVAVYKDAVGGGPGEFRAPSKEVTARRTGQTKF